jgi:hypothetical protein
MRSVSQRVSVVMDVTNTVQCVKNIIQWQVHMRTQCALSPMDM